MFERIIRRLKREVISVFFICPHWEPYPTLRHANKNIFRIWETLQNGEVRAKKNLVLIQRKKIIALPISSRHTSFPQGIMYTLSFSWSSFLLNWRSTRFIRHWTHKCKCFRILTLRLEHGSSLRSTCLSAVSFSPPHPSLCHRYYCFPSCYWYYVSDNKTRKSEVEYYNRDLRRDFFSSSY